MLVSGLRSLCKTIKKKKKENVGIWKYLRNDI